MKREEDVAGGMEEGKKDGARASIWKRPGAEETRASVCRRAPARKAADRETCCVCAERRFENYYYTILNYYKEPVDFVLVLQAQLVL